MNYYERIQNSLDYIEENLNREISLEILAEKSFLSKYYFHRVFTILTGEAVMTYIRKRRLGRAVMQMDETDMNLLEIALDNCFESQEVFSRAFMKHFGISPGRYRKLKEKIALTERISLVGLNKSHNNVHPKIVVSDERRLAGIYFKTTWEENMKELSIARFHSDIFDPKTEKIRGRKNPGVKYGVCEIDFETGEIIHFAAVEIESFAEIPEEMEERIIPYSRYVVFYHKGAVKEIAESYNYIYKEWLPDSGCELSKFGKDMQLYYSNFSSEDDYYEMEIHVPIE